MSATQGECIETVARYISAVFSSRNKCPAPPHHLCPFFCPRGLPARSRLCLLSQQLRNAFIPLRGGCERRQNQAKLETIIKVSRGCQLTLSTPLWSAPCASSAIAHEYRPKPHLRMWYAALTFDQPHSNLGCKSDPYCSSFPWHTSFSAFQ